MVARTPQHARAGRRWPLVLALLGVAGAIGLAMAWRWPARHAAAPPPRVTPVDGQACRDCHAAETAAWEHSHHALAMQLPTAASVLGDFGDLTVRTASTGITRFRQRDGRYWIHTAGPDGGAADYDVRFTFGVDPLQQYLLALPGGRLQAFTLAWDTQRRRWYELNPDADATPRDALHWTGASYNWNYMCADCHSTGVRKNYDASTATFGTTYTAVNVTCEACHDPHSPGTVRNAGRTAAVEIDTCARCHARRATIASDAGPRAPLLDTYVPALIEAPLYHDDGQIRDEVYEYGSFLQSRMHARGVRCSDCHEPHSLRTHSNGNALCTACHNATAPALRHAVDTGGLKRFDYDSARHHFHAPGTPGSQCVDCHMPTRTYMGIDARHDHSLRIPRPDLAVRLGTPNACGACHANQGPAWAADAIARWYGPARRSEHIWGEDLWAGARREPGALRALQSLLRDAATPAIVRASALARLLDFPGEAALRVFTAHLTATEPLVRLQAVTGLELLVPAERVGHLVPLLSDPIRAVRIEAARLLAVVPIVRFAPADAAALRRALEEYIAAQTTNADRPEAHLNLGNLHADQGDTQRAAQAYDAALRLDARFVPAWANRADLEAAGGELDRAERTLRTALRRVPEAAQLHHALGLVLIRQRRGSAALEALREATRLAPDEPRFAYVYGVALYDGVGAARGRAVLDAALTRFPNDRDLLQAVAAYAQAAGDAPAAQRHLQRLHSIEAALAGATP